jgi:hypothetical protein
MLIIGYSEFSGTYNVECFNTYNASLPTYSDITVSNTYDRQWDWFICGGFGWYHLAILALISES